MPDKKKIGRPSDFNRRLAIVITNLANEGKTITQISNIIGVSTSTLYSWLGDNPDLYAAVNNGRAVADDLVEATLFERAIGYRHKETKVFCHEGQIIEHEVEKCYAPDVTAQIFWLKNRRPDEWRDRHNHEVELLEIPQAVIREVGSTEADEEPT